MNPSSQFQQGPEARSPEGGALRVTPPRWSHWMALHLATMGAWGAIAVSPLGSTVATLAVAAPWCLITWKRGWRRAMRPEVDTLRRSLIVDPPAEAQGYREGMGRVAVRLDGRPLPLEEIRGVCVAPRVRVVARLDGEREVPTGAAVYLHLRTRVVRLFDGDSERARELATSLSARLGHGPPRVLLPEVRFEFGDDARSPAGRARIEAALRRHARAPMPSAYYGGMRVLGALFAVYWCTLPALFSLFTMADAPSRLSARAALGCLAGFALADALIVLVWGACFRAPMRGYARERFEFDAPPRR
jgi:hypothetical protein